MSAIISLTKAAMAVGYTFNEVVDQVAAVSNKVADTPWPHIKPIQDNNDYRTLNIINHAKGLGPLFNEVKKRKIRIANSVAQTIQQSVCHTAD